MTAPPSAGQAAAAAAATLALSLGTQSRFDRVIGSDGFFHVAQAARVFANDMPWMPRSVFAAGWVDHQLGFHLLLWPFAALLPPVLAAKVGAAVFCACAMFALWVWAQRAELPSPWLVALLPFATGWLFWLRLEMPRTQALSLVLLLGCLAALREDRPRLLAGLSFAFAWTYHVSLIVLPVAVLWAGVVGLRARSWRPVRLPAAAVAGLAAGFTIHPHSPDTWRFLHQHVVLKVMNRDALPVGLEWTDGGPSALMEHGWPALVALAVAGVALARAQRRSDDAIALALLAGGATAAILSGTKFVEYALPLSVLAAGAAARDSGWAVRRPAVVALLVALGLGWTSTRVEDAVLRTEPDPHRLAPALDAVRAVASPGDVVYHFSWNDFPELVLHGPEFRYIVGLDPHFLALHDPERWRLYEAMGGGFTEDRSPHIRDSFDAAWALLVLPYPGAQDALARDPGLKRLWGDPHAVLYEVAPPR